MGARGDWESEDSAIEPERGELTPRYLRCQRLRVLQYVGFFSYCYFLSADLYHGTFWLPVLDVLCLLCITTSFVVMRRSGQVALAAWLYLLGLNFSFAFSPLFANFLDCPALWTISLLPMLSACVLNERATIVWTLIASLEIILVALAGETSVFPVEVNDTDVELVVILIVSLGVHSLSAHMLSSQLVSQFRLLGDRRRRIAAAHEAESRANDAKTAFLARMSHEIRTPINGLLGLMQELRSRESMGEKRSSVETVQRCGENLLSLLNDILDLSKVESGELEIIDAPLDLCALVRDIQQLFAAQAVLSSVELTAEFESQSYWCVGDDTRIRQVVSNILGNALKFCDGNPVSLKLYSRMEPVSGRVKQLACIEIRDEGIGMTQAQQDKVFEQYEQIDSEETLSKGGTGLGLSISNQLVRKMGGHICLQSSPGKGSTFTVVLPLEPCNPPFSETGAEVATLEISAEPRSRQVLVADDNAINRKVAQFALARLGCRVVLVENGAQALEAANQARFDLILMDMAMPVMNGLEATRKIRDGRGLNARTPIVALTANAFAEDRQACLDAGMQAHLAKPVKDEALARVLDTCHELVEEERQSA